MDYNQLMEYKVNVRPEVSQAVRELHRAHQNTSVPGSTATIETIKSIRAIWPIGLREAKELVDVCVDARPIETTCLIERWEGSNHDV